MRFVDAQREQQIPEFDVEVGPDLEELQTRLYQHVLELVGKEKPVIVFGLLNVGPHDRGVEFPEDVVLHYVRDDHSAGRVPAVVAAADRIVVFVSWDYYFGLDMKFDGEAEVVIYAERWMDYEMLW